MFFRAKLGRRPRAAAVGRKLSSELGCQKNKNDQKKTVVRRRARPRPILHFFSFFTSYRSFWHFLSLQKLFLMFSNTPIYPKDILRNFFANKNFFPKKIIHFFFSIFFFSIFFFSNFLFSIFFFLNFFFFYFFFSNFRFFFFLIFFFKFFFFFIFFFFFFFFSIFFFFLVFFFRFFFLNFFFWFLSKSSGVRGLTPRNNPLTPKDVTPDPLTPRG